jgi:hypothetical protein
MYPTPSLVHLLPMLPPPSTNGDTRTPAVGDKIRYRPSLVGGSAAGENRLDIFEYLEGRQKGENREEEQRKFSSEIYIKFKTYKPGTARALGRRDSHLTSKD